MLELEIKLANEQARLAKLAYEKKALTSKKKTRSQKSGNAASDSPENDGGGVGIVSAQARKRVTYPLLLSEKPLEDLLSESQGSLPATRLRLARKMLKKQARAKKIEAQQTRLIEVFLGDEEN